MTIQDVLDKMANLFDAEALNSEAQKVVDELLTPFVPADILEHLADYNIYTYEQLLPYLKHFKVLETRLGDVSTFPIYYRDEPIQQIEAYRDQILDETVDRYKLCRAHKMLSRSHKQIVTLLTYQPLTLTQIQYMLQREQSTNGVRGRISELVDMGIITRYYFTIRSKRDGEMKSFVYHYLTHTGTRVVDFINTTLESNPHLERAYLGESIEKEMIKKLSTQPRFVVDLAEQFKMTESNMLSILREYNSDGRIKLFYQSVLSDGKNGKFIAYLPELEVELQIIMDELFKFFGEKAGNKLTKFQNLNRTKTLTFEEVREELRMSETLAVAYLTNLRKCGKVEQIGDTVLTSKFVIK